MFRSPTCGPFGVERVQIWPWGGQSEGLKRLAGEFGVVTECSNTKSGSPKQIDGEIPRSSYQRRDDHMFLTQSHGLTKEARVSNPHWRAKKIQI